MKDGLDLPMAMEPDLVLFPVARDNAGAYQARIEDGALSLVTTPFVLEPVDLAWVVRTLNASGPDSLKEVLATASKFKGLNGIQIQVQDGPEEPPSTPLVVRLDGDLPAITGEVCILGPANSELVLDGVHRHRPFFVDGGTLILDNFKITNGLGKGGNGPGGGGGAAGMGGAIFINKGTVVLRRMLFAGNQAAGGDSGMGSDGQAGGGGGFGGDAPLLRGDGGDGGLLGGIFGSGALDPALTDFAGGGMGDGDGAGGGAAIGGTLDMALAAWSPNLAGGEGAFGAGGGFSVGPDGGGGDGGFGGGGGGAGGSVRLPSLAQTLFPGASIALGGAFGGDGAKGDGILVTGRGGGGAGLGGALFLRHGSLAMTDCRFVDNQAIPGTGDATNPALGKGGAIFIYAHPSQEEGPSFDLAALRAQTYGGNRCTNLPNDPSIDTVYDNPDFYVAVRPWLGTKRDPTALQRKLLSIERHLGWPVILSRQTKP
jgi:hypothetical protein